MAFYALDESNGNTTTLPTQDAANKCAERAARNTGHDHSVWEEDDSGLGGTSTGDYYDGAKAESP